MLIVPLYLSLFNPTLHLALLLLWESVMLVLLFLRAITHALNVHLLFTGAAMFGATLKGKRLPYQLKKGEGCNFFL